MARQPSSPRQPPRKQARAKAAPAGRSKAGARSGTQDAPASGPEDMLRAGLKAFRLENLLGLAPPPAAPAQSGMGGLGFGGLDTFGFRKFEDVFDQRVAAALRRMGWAGPEQFQALQQQVEQLQAELDRLRRARRAPAPPARGDR